jgi:hypothetical protein
MEKEFVPYELALRMKQLGFDGSCFAIWSGFDEQNFSITDTIRLYSSGFRINGTQSSKFYINDFNSLRVAAPTFSQAFRWFREKYDLHHVIHQFTFKKGTDEEYLAEVAKADDTFSECRTYEDAEVACLEKLIEIIEEKQK